MSPLFLITASRETEYQIEIQAEGVNEAIETVRGHEKSGELENYVYKTYELEIDEAEELGHDD